MDCTIRIIAKTKALISFAVTAKLICVFVFAYANSRFSHNPAHIMFDYYRYSSGINGHSIYAHRKIRGLYLGNFCLDNH